MKPLILALLRKICVMVTTMKGCQLGNGVILNGLPYIRRKGNSRIILGNGSTINAARWANWLGTPGAMILSAENGAILELKTGAGVSASQIIANIGIEIGENSMVGAGCLICDSDMHEVPLSSSKKVAMAPIKIGKGVFIGARCIILKGVTIGDRAVIGAGSVVSRHVPADSIVAGNPACIVRRATRDDA